MNEQPFSDFVAEERARDFKRALIAGGLTLLMIGAAVWASRYDKQHGFGRLRGLR